MPKSGSHPQNPRRSLLSAALLLAVAAAAQAGEGGNRFREFANLPPLLGEKAPLFRATGSDGKPLDMAASGEQKLLLRVYEDALRLQRGKTAESRNAAAEALAASHHPASLPRLGRGLLDPDSMVRGKVWALLVSIAEVPLPFDPGAADEPCAAAAGKVISWLRTAEKTHHWDVKALRFVPPPAREGEKGKEGSERGG
jgi:hypothetical protein